eukprot:CAMPEP_0119324312 /NCGR_PEP_ID=MMETSP1333-20130426/62823_1 /TAXON_ID=418940 /ORGANISM="Scyphosphaera apsteinii, Strain RCC1455" /LENGTH=390 /DNA_ID=CAMNT_0007331991 /DNA_START=1 /DNA_END=1173 /DNA_ORIENTATION=+
MVLSEEHPVSTITFFNGDPAAAAEFLADRVAHILHLNPCLGGWIEGGKCYYDPQPTGHSGIFCVCSVDEIALSREMSLRAMGAAVESKLCKKGQAGPSESLFRVVLLPDAVQPTCRYALLVTMSHLIGDGYTFYMIHNMLSMTEAFVALTAQRKPQISKDINAALGEDGAAMFNAGFVANAVGGLALAALKGQRLEVRMFHVNEAFIDAQKTEAKASGASFVSSNDIITSWVMERSAAQLGCMAVNFRGRVAGATSDLAGNYESLLFYRPADFASPALLRASLPKLRRASEPPTSLPTSREHLGLRCCTCSNWSTFAKSLALPGGSKQTLHIPLYNLKPGGVPLTHCGCVIFRPEESKPVACMIFGAPQLLAALPTQGELVGESVDVTLD